MVVATPDHWHALAAVWDAWPFDKPFYLILNIAVGGAWGGARGVDPDIFPQRLVVDHVRVYETK